MGANASDRRPLVPDRPSAGVNGLARAPARPRLRPRFQRLCALVAALAAPGSFALSPAEKPADYILTRWDTEDGLPHNSVRAIYQTRDGYLWVGTTQGLARFDGLAFTVFTQHNTPSFPNSQITSFAETSDGSLWIGTSLGLARYQNGRFTAYGRADGLKADTVNTVCVAPDGSLWIGGRGGITRWVAGKFVNDIDTSAYDTLGLRVITVDRKKTMWVASGSEALRYLDGKFTRFGRAEGLPGRRLEVLREDAAGRILAVTQNGVFRLDGARFAPLEESQSFSSQSVGTALADRAGNLWIGSIGGLDRDFNGKVVPYTDRSGNKLGVVDAMFEDREGCLWIGTSAGLYRLTDRRAYSLSSEAGVTGKSITSLRQTRDGALWVASWAGGVDRIQDGAVQHYTRGRPLSHETVTAIYEAPDRTMWLGTRGSSLDRLDGNRVTTFVYQSGVATSRPVTAIYAEPEGEFLLGISKRGLLELRGGQIVPVAEAAALAPETVWTIVRLRDGRLWIGTSAGLYERRADRTWQPVALPGLAQPLVAEALIEDADGTIWIATDGQGLVRWAKGTARAYGSRLGMVDDTIFSVVDDGLGSLWVSSARGLARIRKTEFAEIDRGGVTSLNCMTFGRVDGLLSASSTGSASLAALRLTDGRILTGTDNGVAVIDPRSLQTNSLPPPVVIESVVADDRPLALTPGQTIFVPRGTDRLEIRYTALSLIAPQRLRFRYQLEGSDRRWVEAGHERSAHYTHLAPGAYVFRVLACNNDGVWNDTGATLAVTLPPLFYQTLWFRLAAFALLGGALAGFIGLRLRQLSQREQALARTNTELDRRVRERTAQLSHSHAELQQRESLFRLIFEHAPVGISWHRTDLGADHHFNSAFRRILDLPAGTLPDNSALAALVHPEDAPRQAAMDALIRSGRTDSYTLEQRFVRKDDRPVWGLFATAVVRDPQGQIIQVIGILEDITARKQTEKALRESNEKFHQLADNITDAFWIRSPDLHEVQYVSPAFERIWGRSVASLYANPQQWSDFILADDRERVLGAFAALTGDASSVDLEYRIVRPDGAIRWVHVRGFKVRDATKELIRHIGIVTDITSWKQAAAALAQAHKELVDASRHAGMAEIATSVLHNVGNVLNSVNVSATLVADRVRHSQAGSIAKVAALFNRHTADLADFLTTDARGQMIPAFLDTLAEALAAEQKMLLTELDQLRQNIEHIKEIVAMQQAYATTSGVIETVSVPDLIEGALRIDADALARHHVATIRDHQARPVVSTDRHKVMQILINLVRNAKFACVDSGRPDRQITVRTTSDGRRVQIAIIDNGVGIPAENLTRIFSHGFTTRKTGHGFGLHSGALAARELGGSLTVHSAGPGHGATFVLELPLNSAEGPHA